MNIFVGNLSFDAVEADIKKLFEGFGNVASVVIVRRKEKKTPKSRGFGFVEMPDEQQALAAIAALGGKEFMGRILNVDPARPKDQKAKKEAQAENELKEKRQLKVRTEDEQYPREERAEKKVWGNSTFRKPGTYRGGRRTHSYMKQRGLAGIQEEAKPRQKSQDNPMRWRKRQDQPKPWQKSPGEHKPWQRSPGEHKPWKKTEEGARPWKKTGGESKPWKKTEGESRPWKKPAGESKPWKKPSGGAKPWSKSSERPQKSGFNGRKKPGGYKR